MKPYYEDRYVTIYHGDAVDVTATVVNVTAVVTDPPYELGFMGKSWDSKGVSFRPETWAAIRNACLPGAPLLSFGGSRTQHRIACAIEDAGWELRDVIMYVYGSGFPKSLDIGKAIDKAKGAERKIIGTEDRRSQYDGKTRVSKAVNTNWRGAEGRTDVRDNAIRMLTEPTTPEARLWDGWGTGLKPAYEPIILGMNPLDGTFANNALKHGVAGINVDGCRVGTEPVSIHGYRGNSFSQSYKAADSQPELSEYRTGQGRFPANLIHDGSQQVMELFPETKTGDIKSGTYHNRAKFRNVAYGEFNGNEQYDPTHCGDSGSAARFFYCAKSSRAERDKGCENMDRASAGDITDRKDGSDGLNSPRAGAGRTSGGHNTHPTVKPLALMEYLCKLVRMPEYNLILDPFMGSGTTLLACISLGIPCIGIDSDEHACEIAVSRLQADRVMGLAI